MDALLSLLRRRTVVVAVKAGVACGLAFFLGSLLPEPVDEYKYYAALGAFTVIGLVVVDSLKESVRVFAAVVIGVATALVVQSISWTNFLTVGVAVLVCSLLMALPFLGDQRTWAPLAALFVLATGGPDPQPMVLGYLIQLPLGAVVGIVVNLLVLPPLGRADLQTDVVRVHHLMSEHMHSYADLLRRVAVDEPPGEDERQELVRSNVQELEQAQTQLRTAIETGTRARKGNPRTWSGSSKDNLAIERAEATSRCAATLLAASVVISQAEPGDGDDATAMREEVVDLLQQAGDLFDDPETVRSDPGRMDATAQSVQRVLERARATDPRGGADDLLFGALALTVRDALTIFAQQVAADGREQAGPDRT